MSSVDERRAALPTWTAALAVSARVGLREFHRTYPLPVLVGALYVTAALRTVLYVLLGRAAAGPEGAAFALVGASVLSVVQLTVGCVSDVPMADRWQGTYSRLAVATVPPWAVFAARSLPRLVHGLGTAVVSALTAGAVVGRLDLAGDVLRHLPVVALCVVSSTALGLCVIAPAIGTRYDTVAYNGTIALLTVVSGALVPLAEHPSLDAVGSILPLSHGIAALRAAEGDAVGTQVALEATVGIVWCVAAALAYRAQDRRGRRTGTGAFT